MLTLAIAKGRMLEPSLKILSNKGIIISPSPLEEDRLLIFSLRSPKLTGKHRLLIMRNTDILPYINNNNADMAFLGSDTILERGPGNFYDYADLSTKKCQLVTARLKNAVDIPPGSRIRVATKYDKIARNHYAAQGMQADIIKVRGSVELAVITGLADRIVDIMDTGKTLRENNLEPVEKIADVSTRLIINKNTLKINWQEINQLTRQLLYVE